jgi:DNA mismatch endonuclease, patch repair protein
VFPRLKKIIFVNGCFWHCHGACKVAHVPLSRREYWQPKLKRNRLRDKLNMKKLKLAGWRVLVIWECQLKDKSSASQLLANFLVKW